MSYSSLTYPRIQSNAVSSFKLISKRVKQYTEQTSVVVQANWNYCAPARFQWTTQESQVGSTDLSKETIVALSEPPQNTLSFEAATSQPSHISTGQHSRRSFLKVFGLSISVTSMPAGSHQSTHGIGTKYGADLGLNQTRAIAKVGSQDLFEYAKGLHWYRIYQILHTLAMIAISLFILGVVVSSGAAMLPVGVVFV